MSINPRYHKAGDFMIALDGNTPRLLQCDSKGILLTQDSPVEMLTVSTLLVNPTSTFTPVSAARKIIVNASPLNSDYVKYGNNVNGRRLYLKAGDTIELPATVISFESVNPDEAQEINIIAYG